MVWAREPPTLRYTKNLSINHLTTTVCSSPTLSFHDDPRRPRHVHPHDDSEAYDGTVDDFSNDTYSKCRHSRHYDNALDNVSDVNSQLLDDFS